MIKQIRKNLLTTTSLNIFTYLIPLLVTPYFVRVAGAANFGLLSFVQAIIQYLTLFVGFNLDISVSAEIAVVKEDREKLRHLFWKTMYARIFLLLIASIIFIGIYLFFSLTNRDSFLLLLTFIGLIGYAITPLWFYQGMEGFTSLFVMVAIGKILFAIIIFAFVIEPADYWYYALGMSLSQIISGIMLFIYPIRKYKLAPVKITFSQVWNFLKEKFPLFTGGTMVNFCMNLNITILGLVLTLHDFGIYMAAYKLILVVFTLVTLPLNQSLFPYISRSITDNLEVAISKIRKVVVPGLLYVSLVVCICLFLMAKPIIAIMLGPQFVEADTPFRLMVFSLVANVVTYVITLQLFIKLNLLKDYARITQLSAILSIIITLVFPYLFGLNGAALAWVANEFFLFFFAAWQLRRSGISLFKIKSLHPREVVSFWKQDGKYFLRK